MQTLLLLLERLLHFPHSYLAGTPQSGLAMWYFSHLSNQPQCLTQHWLAGNAHEMSLLVPSVTAQTHNKFQGWWLRRRLNSAAAKPQQQPELSDVPHSLTMKHSGPIIKTGAVLSAEFLHVHVGHSSETSAREKNNPSPVYQQIR